MLEILKNDEVIDRVHPGSRWKVPGENRVVFNVQLDTEIPGYTIREYAPPPPPPESELTPEEIRANMPPLSARQIRLGLIQSGITIAQVEAAIASIDDPSDRAIAEVEWEYASEFRRTHPLIDQVAAELELSPEQIDAMWIAAAQI